MQPLPLRALTLLALILLLPVPVDAARVEGLFRAEVEVVDKGSEARAEGFRRALEQVLIKVSGNSSVIDDPALEPMLETPARYVQRYRYEDLEPEEPAAADGGDAAADPGAADGSVEDEPRPEYRLVVTFGEAQIERELRTREVTVWGAYRPQVLVWLAYDEGRRRGLVAADGETGMHAVVRASAERRGLPLLLPLLDTEDRQRVDFLDVQGGFFDAVREASERYRASIVLVGHVYADGDAWRGEWTLLQGDERRGWLTRAAEAEAAVEAGLGGLADRLAQALAGRDSESRRIRLRVLETRDLADYARLSDYLERLPRIDARRLVHVRPREVLFELELRGRLADLERTIALDDLLVPATVDATDESNGNGPGIAAPETSTGDGSDSAAAPAATDAGDALPLEGVGELDPLEQRDELVYRFTG